MVHIRYQQSVCKNSDENVLKNRTKNLNPSKGEINMLTRTQTSDEQAEKDSRTQTGDEQ